MRRLSKFAFLIIIPFIIAGCRISASHPVINQSSLEQESSKKNDDGKIVKLPESTSNGNANQESVSNEVYNETSKSEQQKPVQPEVPFKGERMNFEILDKLDNTKYSWWLSLNKQHKTPGIPSKAKALIEKYDGIYTGDTSKKVVYLTFDEGYENGYTPKILDTLKENNVKSIFFVTGPYVKDHADLIKRMLDEGHLVGNHSINHPSLPEVKDASLENELLGLEKQFSAKFNKGFRYMRPPRGEYSEKVLAAAQQLGYKTVFWSFAYLDFDVNNQKGPDYAYKMVMDNLHDGAVILLHAVSKDNAEALDRIIKDIRAQGYYISPFDL